MWSALVPLIVASALVPVQIVVTILLLQSTGGSGAAIAFAAGMTAVRLAQGVVFGLILSSSEVESTSQGSAAIASTLLVVVAVLLLVMALRQLLADDDPDATPPRWMQATASMTPGPAFLLGAGLLAISAKFWVFTLSAIAAIGEADLGRSGSVAAFLVFVVLAVGVQLVLIGVTVVTPDRSEVLLDRVAVWLNRHNRVLVVVIGLVFGVWFLVKGLDGLGVW
jgi:Sap, sulfolipid-1-addressing protein